MTPPVWASSAQFDFCLGVGNPGGISNKHHLVEQFPLGWWHLVETQASKRQQCSFQKHVKAMASRQDRALRCCCGAPAPYRSRSEAAGAWTGVLNFGDCPIRQVPCVLPEGVYSSGRIDFSVAYIGSLEITAATIYCPPKGPTFPQAKTLSEVLLVPVTEQLVYGRSGPRVIVGDFNCAAGSLDAMKHWISQGWVELQSYFHQFHGIDPQMTCKEATAPDQLWISPELLPFVVNCSVWKIFPDHAMLIAGLQVPSLNRYTLQWSLPGRIPWGSVDFSAWTSLPGLEPLAPSQHESEGCPVRLPLVNHPDSQDSPYDSSDAFHAWSSSFEHRVSQAISTATAKQDRSFYGRAQLRKPALRRSNPIVLKHTRPGELAQSNGFLNRAISRWFRQLRRLQSYNHAVHSTKSLDNYASRLELWTCIRRSAGFKNGFVAWWTTRPHPMQGAPSVLPLAPPSAQISALILEDFLQHYRRFEHWQQEKRLQSCRNKLQSTARGLFSLTRKDAKPPLDFLEDSHTQIITVVDGPSCLVSVPEPFPSEHIHHWTLQDQPVSVTLEDDHYRIETDLLLVSGQELKCYVSILDENVILNRLADLWTPRWSKHATVSDDHWKVIVDFARDHLPKTDIDLPPISIDIWKRAVHQFKTNAAAGPCGWTREDLINLTDPQIRQVLDFFSFLENGGSWPDQMTTGIIHCLQKKDGLQVNNFRPITVTSMFYRVYAGIRAGQLLAQLSRTAAFMQCGFLKSHQASDIWYFVGVCVEVSIQTATPVHGCVADIIKAYNCLPRFPVFEALKAIGVPRWFLAMRSSHLSSFTRYFVVRRTCGPGIKSCTGFAEGCPLSCAAMCVVGHLWHRWQAFHMPRCLPLSYVDNLELISSDVIDLQSGLTALRAFCSSLDISVDESCLYMWSTSSAGRRALVSQGFTLNRGTRDLGGQVDYTAQLRNKVLTNRIAETLPWYLKLRASRMPQAIKLANIVQVLFPRGLHGCEAIVIGPAHVQKLRAHVMKALRWDRAGTSAVIRISLLHSHLDPDWFQTWHCLTQFCRQCQHNDAIVDWWKMFCQSESSRSNGPFGKLCTQLDNINLRLDEDGRLWFSDNGYINVWNASQALLRRVALAAYHDSQPCFVHHRADYADLDGCDVELTQSFDHTLLPNELEYVNIARDGAFTTDSQKSKFDNRKGQLCPVCGTKNDIFHKYRTCEIYNDIRAAHSTLIAQWARLPDAFTLHGLVPANPWRCLLWEALVSLPDTTTVFAFGPSGGTQHVFTDGSCSNPTIESESLASWAVHQPDKGTISCGYVTGIQQTIARAELTALLSAVSWGAGWHGSLHVWSDNQNIVDHARDLLAGTAMPQDFEHSDLWKQVHTVLTAATASIYFHKVPAHDEEQFCESPYEDWCRINNSKADHQAGLTNLQRPLHFERIWRGYIGYRQEWRALVKQQVSFQLAVAQRDQQRKEDQCHEDESEAEDPFVQHFYEPNQALLAVQFQALQGEDISFLENHTPLFRKVCVQLKEWLFDVDSESTFMRQVSLLEIYVMFRVSMPGRFPLLSDGHHPSLFQVVTFASDFTFFKKIWRHLAKWAGCDWTVGQVSLRHLNILNSQPSIWLGWSHDDECNSFIRNFVGRRAVQSAQALAKNWQP